MLVGSFGFVTNVGEGVGMRISCVETICTVETAGAGVRDGFGLLVGDLVVMSMISLSGVIEIEGILV